VSACPKCGAELVLIPCPHPPHPHAMCGTPHVACPRCRAVPCDACGGQRQPEAEHGLCDACRRAGAVWAARRARAEGLGTAAPMVDRLAGLDQGRPRKEPIYTDAWMENCPKHGPKASDAGRRYCPECAGLPRPTA
jgi:hypothetical protein